MIRNYRKFFFCISYGYISTRFNMSFQQSFEIKVYCDMSIGQYYIFFFLMFQKCQNTCKCIDTSVIKTYGFLCKRRNDIQTSIFTGKIPFTSGSQMIHQRVIIFTYRYGNIVDSTIYHTGHDKIDHTITTCKRNGSHQTLTYQFRYQIIITVREDNSQSICV